VDGVVNSL